MSTKPPNQDRYRFRVLFLHPRHWLTWLGLGFFLILSFLPLSILDWLGSQFGNIAARSNKKRFNIVSTNLSLCFPEKSSSEIEEMVKRNFQAQFRSLIHYCILWWRSASSVRKRIHKSGFEKLEQYEQQDKRVIILLLHNVGLEFAIAGISMDYTSVGPYKPIRNPVLNWVIAKGRIRFGKANGGQIFTREDGLRPLIRETRAGKILVYLADEDLGAERSVFVPFFGVPKATIPVLGRLANSCNAVVLPCVCCYQTNSRRYEVTLLPEIQNLPSGDDERDSLSMNRAIEQAIEKSPVEYLWSLRYFQTRPPGEVSVYE